MSALPAIHAFTGCDTVSAMAGQGKVKALKLLTKNHEFETLFSTVGDSWTVREETLNDLEKFTCQLYLKGSKIERVNEARYLLFRSKQGAVNSVQLPPCQDCFNQHVLRANYQAAIWKRCLENYPEIADPQESGWTIDEAGKITIKWMVGLPAPEIVLELLSCTCSRSCKLPTCSCLLNSLKCTPACKLADCENMKTTESQEDDEYAVDDVDQFSDSEEEDH